MERQVDLTDLITRQRQAVDVSLSFFSLSLSQGAQVNFVYLACFPTLWDLWMFLLIKSFEKSFYNFFIVIFAGMLNEAQRGLKNNKDEPNCT